MSLPVQHTRDAALSVTTALPNGAATVTSSGHDLGLSANANAHCGMELVIYAPAVTTGMLGDAATLKYSVYEDTDSAFGSETLLASDVLVQTGASSAGAAAVTRSVGLPRGVKRYLRVKCTNSAAGNCSTVSMITRLEPVC